MGLVKSQAGACPASESSEHHLDTELEKHPSSKHPHEQHVDVAVGGDGIDSRAFQMAKAPET